MNRTAVALPLTLLALRALSGCTPPTLPSEPTRYLTGTAPNAVARADCSGATRALVAASIDNSLNIINIVDGNTTSVHFGANTNPWDVAVVADPSTDGITDPTAVITLYGANTIATARVCSSTAVVSTFTDDEEIVLDGVSYTPSNPQAIAVVGADIFVASTNIIRVATPDEDMLTGPGTLLRLHLDDSGELVRDARLTLPCENPSSIAPIESAPTPTPTLVVACTGRYRQTADGFVRASDSQGAIVMVDTSTMTVIAAANVDASPVSAVIDVDGSLVVGDALDGSIARYTLAPIAQSARAVPTGVDNDSIFAISVVNNTLVAAAFSGALVGAPLSASPVILATNDGLTRGVVDIAWQPGDDHVFAVLSLSAELARFPVDDVGAGAVQP